MKKVISVILAITLLFAMCVPAFATETKSESNYNGLPVIIVRGIDFAGLTYSNGTKALQVDAGKIISTLFSSMFMTKGQITDSILDIAYEVSSMGIRVSEESLKNQLKKANCEDRVNLPFHRDLLAGKLPYTIGGGLGQSRICMFILRKAHIGEVQSSVWPENMLEECREAGINIL